MDTKEQGENAENIFHGKTDLKAVNLVYKESASLFSEIIKERLKPGKYNIIDFGSHRGEFLEDLINLLPEYFFETIAVDINLSDLEFNKSNIKINSDLSKLEILDKTIDIAISRYTLAWNDIKNQKEILKEIKRVTNKISIIQHQGADLEYPEILQKSSKELFSGIVPKLKRKDFFFSTSKQIEEFMNELGINFERVQNRRVDGLSAILIDKYNLSINDSNITKEILINSDYIIQTTWVLKF